LLNLKKVEESIKLMAAMNSHFVIFVPSVPIF